MLIKVNEMKMGENYKISFYGNTVIGIFDEIYEGYPVLHFDNGGFAWLNGFEQVEILD